MRNEITFQYQNPRPKLRKDLHYNKELQNDFNKYGEENFEFEILERYSGNDPINQIKRFLLSYISQNIQNLHTL